MTLDHDGKIRMDCSSPYAMAALVALRDRYQVAVGNDPDADRHGIVTPSAGLMNPNHFLAVAIDYLVANRPPWSATMAIGKTVVSSSMIDRVTEGAGRALAEVPVGFKWFAPGLFDGSMCFGGEESAGASFLRRNGTVWTTDKDGVIMALLAAEITARTGKDPGLHYQALEARFGTPHYTQNRCAGHARRRRRGCRQLSPEAVTRHRAGRRADRRAADARAGEQRADRRAQGRRGERLVRGPAVGHRERLQDLRGELPQPVASRRHRDRSAAHRRRARSRADRRPGPP